MSHTLRMENLENKTKQGEVFTKEGMGSGVTLTTRDAEEYRAFKKQKKIAEITGAICRSATAISFKEDMKKLVDRAVRFHQAAVQVRLPQLAQVQSYLLKSRVKIDCIIGGNGETLAKVKAYEAKLARKMGAKELTLVLTPSYIATGRYVELKKEIKRVQRAAKTARVKVWVENKYPYPMLARLARLVSEMDVKYFCVPYFEGCQRLRYDLLKGCRLEVSEVENLADFKEMVGAGVERVVTSHVQELYLEWMKEVDTMPLLSEQKPMSGRVLSGENPLSPTTGLKIV